VGSSRDRSSYTLETNRVLLEASQRWATEELADTTLEMSSEGGEQFSERAGGV
jgi:hypothetical protein